MVLPGELDEIARVAQELEAEPPVELDAAADVADEDLRDELLGGLDVATQRRAPTGSRRPSSHRTSAANAT